MIVFQTILTKVSSNYAHKSIFIVDHFEFLNFHIKIVISAS